MSQPTHSSNGNSPALSVIIAVGGQRARAGRALQSLLDQSIIDRMEILLFDWIRQNIPREQLIAGRGFFDHGEVLGRDALIWLPYFTSHRTNVTYLAAALDKGPPDQRHQLRDFQRHLYQRDMSTPESAKWLQEQGFGWFYVGTLEQDKDTNLPDQLARNPGLEVARSEGPARLYHVK